MTREEGARRRHRRDARRDTHGTVAGDRDLAILEALAKMRVLSTAQLCRLYFPSRSATNKRMRRLFDAGLVKVWVDALANENRYSLDVAGARCLARAHGDPAVRHGVVRGLPGDLEHMSLINDIRIGFAVGCRSISAELLWWESDWSLRRGQSRDVVPDALFEVAIQKKRSRCVLEVDNAMKSPRRFLLKILRYHSRRRWESLKGDSDQFIVFAVSREARWAERYRETLIGRVDGGPVWFSDQSTLMRFGVEGAVWRAAPHLTNAAVPLLDVLAGLPYGKEGPDGESPYQNGGLGPQAHARMYQCVGAGART